MQPVESALARMAAGPKSGGAASTGVDFLPLFARAALLKITSHFTLIKKTKTPLERRFLPRALIKADHQSCRDQKHRRSLLHARARGGLQNLYKVGAKSGAARWC